MIKTKLQELASTTESTLSGPYLAAYKFASGFLSGSAFKGNPSCKGALNGIAYYALSVFQYREAYNPVNTFKFSIASQKLTEKTGLFSE